MIHNAELKVTKAPVDPTDVVRKIDLASGGTSLDNITTILMGDPTTYSLANAVVINGGTGYTVGDIVTVIPITGLNIDLEVVDVDSTTGAILNVLFPFLNESADFAHTSIVATGGTGSGATFQLVTMYGVGLETINGILSLVPSKDPLVQYSMLIGYVRDILKTKFPISTDDIADFAITPDKIDDGTIYAGSGISINKTSDGIEISTAGGSPTGINVTFTNYDQFGNLIV